MDKSFEVEFDSTVDIRLLSQFITAEQHRMMEFLHPKYATQNAGDRVVTHVEHYLKEATWKAEKNDDATTVVFGNERLVRDLHAFLTAHEARFAAFCADDGMSDEDGMGLAAFAIETIGDHLDDVDEEDDA